MLETWNAGGRDVTFNFSLGDSWINQSMGGNQLAYELARGEGHAPLLTASEDELIEVEHLLAEPQDEKILDDGFMYLNLVGTEKCSAVEEFTCIVDYDKGQETGYGKLDKDTALTCKQDLKYEFVDSMLQGVDEVDDLQLTCNLSTACPDYLLGISLAESSPLMVCSSHSGSRNSGSECHTTGIERESEHFEMSELSDLSIATNPLHVSISDQSSLFLENMSIHELQDYFRSIFGRDTYVRDKQWLIRRILFGLQNFTDIGNISSLLESEVSSIESEVNMLLIPGSDLTQGAYSSCTNILESRSMSADHGMEKDRNSFGDPIISLNEDDRVTFGLLGDQECEISTCKRPRKPTRRYIEETSVMESRCCNERVKTTAVSSADKLLHDPLNNWYHHRGTRETVIGSGIHVPFRLCARRGRPRKDAILMGNGSKGKEEQSQFIIDSRRTFSSSQFDSDSQDDLSDDSLSSNANEKSGIRRQHHRQWVSSEVMKLIDGVSQYGVGRWTEIKRKFFPLSSHRTPVDLKDKWRNLLRASGAQIRGRGKVTKQQKSLTVSIPEHALRRVRELAIIHPYPREKKLRISSSSNPGTS